MADEKYIIHNTTRKDADEYKDEDGNDRRTTLEKSGHVVSFRGDKGRSIMIAAGGRPAFVSELDEGLLGLQDAGAIRIEKFEGLDQAMDSHKINSQNRAYQKHGTKTDSKQKNMLLTPEASLGVDGVSGAPGHVAQPARLEKDGGETRDERMASRQARANPNGAKATKTGFEDHTPRGGREHEDAKNPDGEPNFLAKAGEVKRESRKTTEANDTRA